MLNKTMKIYKRSFWLYKNKKKKWSLNLKSSKIKIFK